MFFWNLACKDGIYAFCCSLIFCVIADGDDTHWGTFMSSWSRWIDVSLNVWVPCHFHKHRCYVCWQSQLSQGRSATVAVELLIFTFWPLTYLFRDKELCKHNKYTSVANRQWHVITSGGMWVHLVKSCTSVHTLQYFHFCTSTPLYLRPF